MIEIKCSKRQKKIIQESLLNPEGCLWPQRQLTCIYDPNADCKKCFEKKSSGHIQRKGGLSVQKTPDEIKKGLECCNIWMVDEPNHCMMGCPYFCTKDCADTLMKDALALIQSLEADNAQQARCIENLTDKLNAAHDETAKLQAERHALIDACKDWGGTCATCEHFSKAEDDIPCRDCIEMHTEDEDRISHWRWRGVQKEE